ncbi:D-alanine-D-alanine ligase [Lachnospiraceae bacterium XBB1006]|nr:D-alanine-D-alanine ligase [Lachnospiraceae bacterium XBB1006]
MKNLMLVFGGQSSEHEVSCVSATTIAKAIDKEKYQVYLVGITKEGNWLLVDSIEDMQSGEWRKSKKQAILSADATRKELLIVEDEKITRVKIDVAFPALHGLYGEDGTIQGLFELAGIPYVGCGVLASAVSMDKVYTKIIVDTLGIAQAQFVDVRKEELAKMDEVLDRVEEKLSYPVFVKPSNAGSSCGVTKAENRAALTESLRIAAQHDRKILVEETIVGRELECAVLGNHQVDASGVGEILAAEDAAFYDYDAKYNNAASKTVIGPELPEGKEEEIRESAKRIFKAVDGMGLARVDFFLENGTNRVVFNELNTLPGFTSISMYPMLWKDKGLSVEALVERLISLAEHRFFTEDCCDK